MPEPRSTDVIQWNLLEVIAKENNIGAVEANIPRKNIQSFSD